MSISPSKKKARLQVIFDIAAEHLLTQRARSVVNTSFGATCVYRGENGLQCAAGPFLPDDVAVVHNSLPIDEIDFIKKVYTVDEVKFIRRLQAIHDYHPDHGTVSGPGTDRDRETVARWPQQLRKLADSFNLSTAVVDRLAY